MIQQEQKVLECNENGADKDKYIGGVLKLKGGKKFSNGTTIKTKFAYANAGENINFSSGATGNKTISNDTTDKLLDTELGITGYQRFQVKLAKDGIKVGFQFEITLPTPTADDLEAEIVTALFDAATEATGETELKKESFIMKKVEA